MTREDIQNAFIPPQMNWDVFLVILPFTIVVCAGIVGLIIEMARPKQNNNAIVITSLLGLVAAAVSIVMQFGMPRVEVLAEMAVRDHFSLVMQLLLVGSAALAIMFSEGYLREKRIAYGEFYPMVLWSIAGGMLMVSTQNLLMAFVGLELLSISLYVLAGLSRKEAKSEESALKYFLLGSFASAFFLYGAAFLYGASGTLHLPDMGAAWDPNNAAMRGLFLFGLAMVMIGLSFKNGFVPFHQWTPDVYQGAPTNVTALMAASSKIAAFGLLYRVLEGLIPLKDLWIPALFWIAILTMTVGNLLALVQRDVKRVLGYSSIAHAGYILVGLTAHFQNPGSIGFGAIMYYLFGYTLMTVGAFAVVSLIAKSGKETTRLQDLNGLWKRSPLLAVALVIFMASLIGIPGTVGFVGKLFIFLDALEAGLVPLAVVLAINSVFSIFYYLGIALAAFVNEEAPRGGRVAPVNFGLASTTLVCAVGVILGFLFANPINQTFRGTIETDTGAVTARR